MRRKDREINTAEGIEEIIQGCKTIRIGMMEEQRVHIIPVNFGYEREEDGFSFFIHSAKTGHKVEIWEKNPEIAFEMDAEIGLNPGPRGCDYGFFYRSVIGHGRIRLLEEQEEKDRALNLIMRHQTGRAFEFSENNLKTVNVYKISVTDIVGKACLPKE